MTVWKLFCRWVFGTPLSVLDVLARTARDDTARADAKASHAATKAVETPLFSCPHCGETMCCTLMAETLTDHEWENGR